MKQIYHDEECIALQQIEMDKHIKELATLAWQKVCTLKLSYEHEAYKASRGELKALVKRTLLGYVTTDFVLEHTRFYADYCES